MVSSVGGVTPLILQAIAGISRDLEITQLRVTTGLRVSGPQDDPAAFAIAQRVRGDIAGLGSVKTALSTGDSTIAAAIAAGESIADLLTEIKAKVVSANDSSLSAASRSALHNDFVSLRDQITSIVLSAEFNNINLVQSAATTLSVLSTVDGSTITITSQALDTTSLSVNALDLTDSAGATSALTLVSTAITNAANKLGNLGSSAVRVQTQSEFTEALSDILEVEVGNFVDADLTEESARLTSLQIQEQIAIQGLAMGEDFRGDELPEELQRREKRLAAIQAAKARLEAAQRGRDDERGREPGQDRNPRGGRPYKRAYGEPEPKAQSNFTDPESQIMKTSSEGFQQCSNAQMAVDGEHQIIVATQVGPQASDQGQLVGMLDEINETFGVEPAVVLADAGYCNEPDLLELEDRGIDAHVALGREGKSQVAVDPARLPATHRMGEKLASPAGKARYAQRKWLSEAPNGWIKEVLGFRRFSLRGLAKVRGENGTSCAWR